MPPSTLQAPVQTRTRIAELTITNVNGFIKAEIFPTKVCSLVNCSFSALKWLISSSSLLNARITRTPVRFSLVIPSTRSSCDCTFLYSGMLESIMPNTTTDRSGIVITKIMAALKSIVNAIIIEPNTMNGERMNRRSTRFVPV